MINDSTTNGSWTKPNKMKKITIFSVALFCCIVTLAQPEFGIFAGPHASSAIYAIQNAKQSTDSKFGFHAGVDCKIPFENKLTFVPALSYKMMGYKVVFDRPSFPPDMLAKDNDTRFHEVDIDLLLQYDLSKSASHFFLRAGPSFNFILFGKEHYNLLTGEDVDRNMKFSVLNSYGRYGAAVVAQVGYETASGFVIYGHYVQHLISMSNEENGPSIRNRMVGITFGRFFKSKKIALNTKNRE
jgi:hypothetical protein